MSREYPPDWNSRRKAVYQRDNFSCQNCGRKGGPHGNYELHAHHIVPKSKGGTHKKSNLKTLCKQCHNAIHGNRSAPTKTGYIGSSNGELDINITKAITGAIGSMGAGYPLTMGVMSLLYSSFCVYFFFMFIMGDINGSIWTTSLNSSLFLAITSLLSFVYIISAYKSNVKSIEDLREDLKQKFQSL